MLLVPSVPTFDGQADSTVAVSILVAAGPERTLRLQTARSSRQITHHRDSTSMSAIPNQALGSFSAVSSLVGPKPARFRSILSRHPGGKPAEILEQARAHDGDGPKFAQFQGGHRLVSGYETVSFPDPPGHRHARSSPELCIHPEARRWTVRQARISRCNPLAVSIGRANLFFNHIEVIKQPSRRCNPAIRLRSLSAVVDFNRRLHSRPSTRRWSRGTMFQLSTARSYHVLHRRHEQFPIEGAVHRRHISAQSLREMRPYTEKVPKTAASSPYY